MALAAHAFSLLHSIPQDYQDALELHNNARKDVGVEPLIWSEQLAREAQRYASEMARTGKFEHAEVDDGENLYWHSAEINSPGVAASNAWIEEKSEYNHRGNWNDNWQAAGHYTQIVWRSTTHMGLGVAVSNSGETYVVARYNPPGNFFGEKPY